MPHVRKRTEPAGLILSTVRSPADRAGVAPTETAAGGVADMSGANMRQIVAVIEQNMEMLRETAIHGSGDMKALAIALLKAREEALPKGGEFLSDFSTPLPPEDATPEEAD